MVSMDTPVVADLEQRAKVSTGFESPLSRPYGPSAATCGASAMASAETDVGAQPAPVTPAANMIFIASRGSAGNSPYSPRMPGRWLPRSFPRPHLLAARSFRLPASTAVAASFQVKDNIKDHQALRAVRAAMIAAALALGREVPPAVWERARPSQGGAPASAP